MACYTQVLQGCPTVLHTLHTQDNMIAAVASFLAAPPTQRWVYAAVGGMPRSGGCMQQWVAYHATPP